MIERLTSDVFPGEALNAVQPIGLCGQPEEVAAIVVWLCSDEASLDTQQVVGRARPEASRRAMWRLRCRGAAHWARCSAQPFPSLRPADRFDVLVRDLVGDR